MNQTWFKKAFSILIAFLLFHCTMFYGFFQSDLFIFSLLHSDKDSITPLRDDSNISTKFPYIHPPSFMIQPFHKPNILFIVGDPTSLDPIEDQPFDMYMNSTLNYAVTYHDDNDSYSYGNYDAIVISQSIVEEGTVDSLYTASIPILTMEAGTWNEFELGLGGGITSSQVEFNILNNSHYITDDLNLGYVEIYNVSGGVGYLTGYNNPPVGSGIVTLVKPNDLPQNKWDRSLVVLEKGQKDWNLTLAPERRVFWGAAQGLYLNQTGWETWEKALKWILYDDRNGSATITVNVKDLDNQVVSNARVNLTHSYNTNQNSSQNTTITGQTTFFNIPYGSYNITVEFEGSINDTLSLLEIVSEYTYNMTANFDFTVRIDEYIDNDPPTISNVGFISSNKTFRAEIFDDSVLTTVNISLTAANISHTINRNHTMVTTDGTLYFNDTVAQGLSTVNVTYNITAIDIAGNIRISENYSFLLGDITPPTIYEYNVTDYENGTLQFYANITDTQSDVQDPVILRINDSFVEMHLNASGYWVYHAQTYYDITLNYTIWSANDSIGNWEENITEKFALTPKFGLTTPKDSNEPHIWGLGDIFAVVHKNGYVVFTSYVYDWNEFQSGTNLSSVQLTLSVNGDNTSYLMTPIGAITYSLEFRFNFEDTVYYWVNASDLAGNTNPGIIHGPFIIDDNVIPIVSYWAEEWGNGTVDFHAEVVDWPNNDTTTFLSYTQNWFDMPWPNITMTQISDSHFSSRVYNNKFLLQNIWFYATAVDSSDNAYEPTLDQALNITVTDKVPPTITLAIENSTQNDGEITVISYAIDPFSFSSFVNNTFYINMSFDSTSINTIMEYESFYHYWFKTYGFPFGEEVNISIGVYDEAGNFGKIDTTVIIGDYTPPNIKNYGAIVYQNGTATVWADIAEGDNGSGLIDDNSSVTIIFIHKGYQSSATMMWNGSENFYSYPISGFVPGLTFTYQIKAIDKIINVNITGWESIYIPDETPPVYNSFNYSEKLINHTASELTFWAEVDDPFGDIAGVNISIEYFNDFQWLNWTSEMNFNGSHYLYSIQLMCNNSFNYNMKIYDEAPNVVETPVLTQKTLNFLPTTAMEFGVGFNILELNPGEVRFWIRINDTFEDHTFKDHEITLSIMDETLGSSILNQEIMNSNGTHHIYDLSITYGHNFSYIMQVIDDGVLGGFYNPHQYSNSGQMLDYWKPILLSSGIDQINETSIIIWANVSDWGSGVTKVLLKYEFVPFESNGGEGSQIKTTEMSFNESMYVTELTFSGSGIITWFIEIYDVRNTFTSSLDDYTYLFPAEPPVFLGLTFLQIAMVILGTAAILIALLFGGNTIRKKRSVKYQRIKDTEDKLFFISNVYTILVSTGVGLPIFSVSNVLYQKDALWSDTLSGLSVGIDAFLQSFQSDFMHQVQQQRLDDSTETELDENIRISVIEQQQFQILIAASENYRIFAFLKEKPPIFAKRAFYEAIKDLEETIHIPNLGVVDEALHGPQTAAVLRKYFPTALLMPFIIDTTKLKEYDAKLKRGLGPIPISGAGIEALKRLVITQTSLKIDGIAPQAEIKQFDEAIERGLLKDPQKMLFTDASNIMKKILKIPLEQIYEALWIGSSPDVGIIRANET